MHTFTSALQPVYLIEKALNKKRGLNINEENISNVRFADDTALFAGSDEDLQEMVKELN